MGFEQALRTSHWAALEWWFYELPQLANRAPPSRGAQMTWVPLQRVLLPGYLVNPDTQADTVRFLMAHGADPRIKLPFDQGRNVIGFAAAIKSPMVALLDAPAARAVPVPTTTLAQTHDRHRSRPSRRGVAASAPGGALRSQVADQRHDAALIARSAVSRWRSCRARRARARAGRRAGRGSSSGTSSAGAGSRRGRRASPRPRPESSSGCRPR